MKKLFILLLACSSPFLLPVEAGPLKRLLGLEYDYSETVEIDIPQQEVKQKWKRANAYASENGQSIVEWIPKEQNFENRSELITVQFVAHSSSQFKPRSAVEYANALYAQSSRNYPGMQRNVIKQSDYDVLYEWSLPNGYKNFPPQHEIVRIIWTEKGIHRVAYEKKVRELDQQTRDLWLSRIGTAKLVY